MSNAEACEIAYDMFEAAKEEIQKRHPDLQGETMVEFPTPGEIAIIAATMRVEESVDSTLDYFQTIRDYLQLLESRL